MFPGAQALITPILDPLLGPLDHCSDQRLPSLINYPVRSCCEREVMGYRTALSTACLSGTLEDKLAAAAAARFHSVELTQNDLLVSSWSPRRVGLECERRGLAIDAYQPFADVEAVPPHIFAAVLRRAEKTLAMLAQLGARTLVVCSSTSPDAVDDDDLAAE